MKYYYVNNNPKENPNYNHEVHTEEHAKKLDIKNKSLVGYCRDEIEAVDKAKKEHYDDADGCAECCPLAHYE